MRAVDESETSSHDDPDLINPFAETAGTFPSSMGMQQVSETVEHSSTLPQHLLPTTKETSQPSTSASSNSIPLPDNIDFSLQLQSPGTPNVSYFSHLIYRLTGYQQLTPVFLTLTHFAYRINVVTTYHLCQELSPS